MPKGETLCGHVIGAFVRARRSRRPLRTIARAPQSIAFLPSQCGATTTTTTGNAAELTAPPPPLHPDRPSSCTPTRAASKSEAFCRTFSRTYSLPNPTVRARTAEASERASERASDAFTPSHALLLLLLLRVGRTIHPSSFEGIESTGACPLNTSSAWQGIV